MLSSWVNMSHLQDILWRALAPLFLSHTHSPHLLCNECCHHIIYTFMWCFCSVSWCHSAHCFTMFLRFSICNTQSIWPFNFFVLPVDQSRVMALLSDFSYFSFTYDLVPTAKKKKKKLTLGSCTSWKTCGGKTLQWWLPKIHCKNRMTMFICAFIFYNV